MQKRRQSGQGIVYSEVDVKNWEQRLSFDPCSPRREGASRTVAGPFGQFVVTTEPDRTASVPNAGAGGWSLGEVVRYVA
jgi:hypothetical protein